MTQDKAPEWAYDVVDNMRVSREAIALALSKAYERGQVDMRERAAVAKPLEWDEDDVAATPFGKYRVVRTDDGYALTFEYEELAHIGFNAVASFESPRLEAMNRAQPDYEARIKLAIRSLPIDQEGK